ncbi:MAG: DUF4011 domain-containing protein [Deltaproteobacteria bacterium]|nr:DUF4011 domain-containing protein [Deltaproteobacteria bacterium]
MDTLPIGYDELLRTKLALMRKKVIDLSNRNPLINVGLSPRSASIVRVVDELPEILAYRLRQRQTMAFKALPELDENNPADEKTSKFRAYLNALKAEDMEYLDFAANQTSGNMATPEEVELEERKLKDKVRAILKLPPRPAKGGFNLEDHARANGIDPSFELPAPGESGLPNRQDYEIQTLFLPSDLNRRLTALYGKCRTWEEETGINAFHAAFGLLRWSDASNKDKIINSPLVLLPVKLELRRSNKGPKFLVTADGDDCVLNFVLSEKLKLEHSLQLPDFQGGQNVEDYFETIKAAIADRDKWSLSRQVIFGIFPSAKMAIYHDLNPDKSWYSKNRVIVDLLYGRETAALETVAPTYDVDKPEIDRSINPLVLSADSSQVSAVYDAMAGKNLALEGPPGTGKSQSIVNIIAAALKKGHKVLFVAEKMAALEVVKSRLEAIGLGNFLLPLQANRSERAQVVAALRSRVNMAPPPPPPDFAPLNDQLNEARHKLNAYISLISEPFGSAGLSIRDVLGRFRATAEVLNGAPRALDNPSVPELLTLDKHKIEALKKAANDLEKAALEAAAASDNWRGLKVYELDAILAKSISDQADLAYASLSEVSDLKARMSGFALDDLKDSEIDQAISFLGQALGLYPDLDHDLVERLSAPGGLPKVNDYLDKLERHEFLKTHLSALLTDAQSSQTLDNLTQAAILAEKMNFHSLDLEKCHRELAEANQDLNEMIEDLGNLTPVVKAYPIVGTMSFDDLAAVREHVLGFDPRVLNLRTNPRPAASRLSQLSYLLNQGLALRNQQTELAAKFPIKTSPGLIPPPQALMDAAERLRKDGFFSRLFGPFRAAKALYHNLTRVDEFDSAQAAHELSELATFIQAKQRFETAPELMEAFPNLFYGLNSDLNLMLGLVNYYQLIDQNFAGLANQEIANLLCHGEANLLSSIPAVKSQEEDDYEQLKTVHADLDKWYHEGLTAYEKLAKLLFFGEGPNKAKPLIKADPQSVDAFIEAAKTKLGEKMPHVFTPQEIAPAAAPLSLGPAPYGAPDPALALAPYPALPAAQTFVKLVQERFRLKGDLESDQTAKELLGEKFQGPETTRSLVAGELEALKLIEQAGPNGWDLYRALSNEEIGQLPSILTDIKEKLINFDEALSSLTSLTGVDFKAKISPLSDQEAEIFAKNLAGDQKGLFAHAALEAGKKKVNDLGLAWFLGAFEAENKPLKNLAAVLEAAIYRAMALKVRQTHNQELLNFSSLELNRYREALAQRDLDLIKWARLDLARALFMGANPPVGVSFGRKSDYTQYSLLVNEIGKKKQFTPIRNLIGRAAQAIMELKPCWMMSPTAVSQYLSDESVTFDLGILDEASQMPPENAIPSLARCKQIIIVGDTNQLPPTNFFQKNVLAESYVDEDGGEAEPETLEESILEVAIERFSPKRRLLWHYRSRHSALINFCNHVIYDDELTVYPSPSEKRPDMGLTLVKVPGLYQRSLNPIEAQTMVKWALSHMKNDPNRSLGLVTFNEKQRSFISDLMERAIESNDYALKYVDDWKNRNDGLETFFVKNLENVQGDERDVIFIGTVYGPEKKDGPVAQRFGPVTGASGRRRLNVLFSRAKQKIVTFTSMGPADVKANEADQTGTSMLKQWLTYCEMGGLGQEFKKRPEGLENEPSLEKHVLSKVKALGFQVDQNVGTEGYALDLTVASDSYPMGYLMGLEGDGPSYNQNVSDRDRDRLRPEVLTGLGWKLGRLWTSAWYANPDGELEALKTALDLNLSEAQAALAKLPPTPDPLAAPGSPADGFAPDQDIEDDLDQELDDEDTDDDPGVLGPEAQSSPGPDDVKRVAVGDLVKIKYLDPPQSTKEIFIVDSDNGLGENYYPKDSPLALVLLDQEEEDEVQFLRDKRIKNILIESITKGAALSAKPKPAQGVSISTRVQFPAPTLDDDGRVLDDDNGDPEDGREENALLALLNVAPGDQSRLQDPDYREALSELSLRLIDGLGPIQFMTVSQVLAKAHGYNRRGPNIDKAIKKAIGNKREKTSAPNKEIVYWPLNVTPAKIVPFRGLEVNGIPRDRKQIPYPELLGLAREILKAHPNAEQIPAMAAELGIGRLTNQTRDHLSGLLKSAKLMGTD